MVKKFLFNVVFFAVFSLPFASAVESLDLYAMEDLEGKKVAVFDLNKIYYAAFYSKINKDWSFVKAGDDVNQIAVSLDNINGNTIFNIRKAIFGTALVVGSNGNISSPHKIPYVLGKDRKIPGNFFLKTKIPQINLLPKHIDDFKSIDLDFYRKISDIDLNGIDNSLNRAKDAILP